MSSRRSRSGGNTNRKHIQAVIQIAAKLPLVHAAQQIPVSGRDQPEVNLQRFRAAQPFEFLILQYPKQLRLQLQRNFSNFIQKQRPVIG